ncbi:MAG: triose-phosphate isomerase family protein [Acidimicrobiales bacterium]|jgi:triosephosphate isomerase
MCTWAGDQQVPERPSVTIGVGLKMYLGYRRTMTWCERVADVAASHRQLFKAGLELFVLPSFPALTAAIEIFAGTGILVGSQDLCSEDSGPFTGEVSGSMLAEIGCRYAEVGHAERRRIFHEDDTVVALKTKAALRNGLVPILCVGEEERLDKDGALAFCAAQLGSALSALNGDAGGRVIVAYEPVWAIGATAPAPPSHIRTVCDGIRRALETMPISSSSILYGGTAGPGLLVELADSVDGLFLGRSAHDPTALGSVLNEAAQLLA